MSLLATPTAPTNPIDLTDLTADHGDHCEAQFPAVGGRDIHLRGITISITEPAKP